MSKDPTRLDRKERKAQVETAVDAWDGLLVEPLILAIYQSLGVEPPLEEDLYRQLTSLGEKLRRSDEAGTAILRAFKDLSHRYRVERLALVAMLNGMLHQLQEDSKSLPEGSREPMLPASCLMGLLRAWIQKLDQEAPQELKKASLSREEILKQLHYREGGPQILEEEEGSSDADP